MNYDFDRQIDRNGTRTFKWDNMQFVFGRNDLLPMWVADMDFEAPPGVREALMKRAEHGVYGYTFVPEPVYSAVQGWMAARHEWEVKREWISLARGVMPSVALAVQAFTEPGDGVIIQSPVYHPFFTVVLSNKRQLLVNQLINKDGTGRYEIDFSDLEQKLRGGAKMLLLCSPHNPVGRVWTEDELLEMGKLCARYSAIVVSDEIHHDIVYPGNRHIPFGKLPAEYRGQAVICAAPSKTFNIAGLTVSENIIPGESLRNRFRAYEKRLSGGIHNLFSTYALEAAYSGGAEWLDQLLEYLQGNIDFAASFLREELPEITARNPEGTFLLWLDCRGTGSSPEKFSEALKETGKLGLSAGGEFGPGGEGFQRMNVACPRAVVKEGLSRLKRAVLSLR